MEIAGTERPRMNEDKKTAPSKFALWFSGLKVAVYFGPCLLFACFLTWQDEYHAKNNAVKQMSIATNSMDSLRNQLNQASNDLATTTSALMDLPGYFGRANLGDDQEFARRELSRGRAAYKIAYQFFMKSCADEVDQLNQSEMRNTPYSAYARLLMNTNLGDAERFAFESNINCWINKMKTAIVLQGTNSDSSTDFVNAYGHLTELDTARANLKSVKALFESINDPDVKNISSETNFFDQKLKDLNAVIALKESFKTNK
jgi:hypothetical protein